MTTETSLEQSQDLVGGNRFNLSSIVLLISVVVIVIIIGTALGRQLQTQPTSGPAPDFTMTTFDGEDVTLSDYRGQVVVVNFWASWCDPCRDEAPILQSLWERYRDRGVVLVGVAYLDLESAALDFIDEFGITYPNGPDVGSEISRDYNIEGVPETFIIDQTGDIAYFAIAPIREGQLDPTIDRLLATGGES